MVSLSVLVAAILVQAAAAPLPAEQPKPAPRTVDELIVIAPKAADDLQWASKLNLDVKGGFARSPTPILRRPPTNGCRPMAGGATSQDNRGGVAGGLVCAKPF